MKPDVLVFYAGQLLVQYTHEEYMASKLPEWTAETYNGSYVCILNRAMQQRFGHDPGWYRPDFTPLLEREVPKELLVLKLLLT